jgi:hypothetical protein
LIVVEQIWMGGEEIFCEMINVEVYRLLIEIDVALSG